MTKLPMLVLGLVVATTTVMRAQPPRCTDPTTLENITDNVLRTSGNSVFSFSQSYVTGDYADTWTVYAAAQITLNGNSIHSGSDTEGPLETASVSWTDTLSTTGPGTFAEADQHRFTNTCGANDYYAYTDRNLTVSQPTIATPQPNPYGAGYWAMWYFNGFNYYNTVNLTASPNLGTCSGCSPAYGWEIIDQPSGAAAVSFSSTTSTQTTVTSQMASSGPEFDVSIVFTVGWFRIRQIMDESKYARGPLG